MEEAYIGAQEFCARVRQEEAAVLRAEPALLQALRFDLITFSPYRALSGFLMARPRHFGCKFPALSKHDMGWSRLLASV